MVSKTGKTYGSVELDNRKEEEQESPSTVKVHLALVAAYVCWGGGAIVGKFGVHGSNPIIFEFWREAIMVVVMLLWRLSFSKYRLVIDTEDMPRMVLGGLAYCVNQLFWFIGIKINDPVIGSTWQTFLPILTAFISVCLGQEQLRCEKLLGIVVAAAGAAFMVVFDSKKHMSTSSNAQGVLITGHILFFLNILGNSAYFLLLGKLGNKYSAQTNVMWSNMISGSVMAAVAAFLHTEVGKPLQNMLCYNDEPNIHEACAHSLLVSKGMILPLAYEAFFCSVVALTLLNWANNHTEASVVTVYSAVHAMTSTLISAVVVAIFGAKQASAWGLRMPGMGTAGTGMIILGLLIVFHYDRKHSGNRATHKALEAARV